MTSIAEKRSQSSNEIAALAQNQNGALHHHFARLANRITSGHKPRAWT
ncbi:hypothetical protein ACFQL7_17200 [Halocatena marina]|uniref:Uncharacterized protein n=1 Tax=Halocatena marina TaxID=2934937 RepID=A0ABD5YPT0_9EURY